MKIKDKFGLENVLTERAYELAKIVRLEEYKERTEEGRWLLKKFIEKLEGWEHEKNC